MFPRVSEVRMNRAAALTSLALLLLTIGFRDASAEPLHPGDVLIATISASSESYYYGIARVDPVSGEQSLLTTDDLLNGLYDVTICSEYLAYAASQHGGSIIGIDIDNGTQSVVSAGNYLRRPTGVTYVDGQLLVTDLGETPGEGIVVSVDPATGDQTLIPFGDVLSAPVKACMLPNGDVIVNDFGSDAVARLFRLDSDTQEVIPLVDKSYFIRAITISPEGMIYAAICCGEVATVDPETGAVSSLPNDGSLYSPWGIAVEESGQLLVTNRHPVEGGNLVRVDPNTGTETIVTSGEYLENYGLGISIWSGGPIQARSSTWGRLKGTYR